jgi:hypothetical protein
VHPRLPLLAAVAVAPRRTMRWMLDHPERRQSFAVVVAAAVSWSIRDLSIPELSGLGDSLGLSTAILVGLLAIFLVTLMSLLFFFAQAAAATAAGRYFLGGTGRFGEVRTALAWGLAPQVWAMFYRIPAAIFWPQAMAQIGGNKRRLRIGEVEDALTLDLPSFSTPFVVLALLEIGCLVWYLVVGSRTLAEAQRFSPAKGLANLLVAVVLPFVVMIVIVAAAALAMATT